MLNTIVPILVLIATLMYSTKYINAAKKMNKTKSSRTTSKKYFVKSILFEMFCLTCGILTLNWTFMGVAIVSLIGNVWVFTLAVKYMTWKHFKKWDDKFFWWLHCIIRDKGDIFHG